MARGRAGVPGRVDRYIASKLKGRPGELYEAAGHLIVHGGKRLRPLMAVRSCQVLGGSAADAMPAAGAVEMIHNFTLVHDDIMDNDEVRHGVKTVHKRFGMPVAILAGDVLFSKAYQAIADSGLSDRTRGRLVSRLARACVDVCEGQLSDIRMAEGRRIPSQSEYVAMISKKTAALFDASCAMGAICAGGRERGVADLSAFGRNLGIAFQITDDLIGVMGDPRITKKPVGNDLREGKKSLPILMAIGSAGAGERRAILRAFGNPRISKAGLLGAVEIIRSLGIEEDVRRQALRYASRAERSLGRYSGPARDDLAGLLDFVVKRDA